MSEDSRLQDDYRAKRRVTVVGAVINLILAAAKVVFGVLGQSQALVGSKYNSQGADAEHPCGHARFEDAARQIANDMSDQAGQSQHVGKVSVYFQ